MTLLGVYLVGFVLAWPAAFAIEFKRGDDVLTDVMLALIPALAWPIGLPAVAVARAWEIRHWR